MAQFAAFWIASRRGRTERRMHVARFDGTVSARSLLPVYTVIFVGFVGYSLMITVFTPMLMYAHNGMLAPGSPMARRTIALGVLLSLYPLGQFFGSPVLGALSDRFGRKPMLLASLGVTTVCYALIGTALTVQSLALLMFASLAAGLAEANVVIAQSTIADVSTESNRNRLFGYIYMSASLAYVVGPLVGGKLADPSLGPWFSYATPYWCVFGLLLVTLLWTALVFRETHGARPGAAIDYRATLTKLLGVFSDRRLRLLYGMNFLLYLAIFGFFRCYPMYLVDEFHLNVSRVSEFIAWVAVPIVIANLWLTDFLARRFATRRIVIASAVLTGVCMVAITLPRAESALWITLFATALPLAVCLPACATMISVAVDADEQGRAMGHNQSLQVGAEALSGLLGGVLAAVVVKLPLIVLAAISVVAGVVLAVSKERVEPMGVEPTTS
jgi:predicted MFS family arabinose efflux permease